LDALVVASHLSRLDQVFGKELALLVEVVPGALFEDQHTASTEGICCTHHIDKHLQWALPLLDKLCRVVLLPLLLLVLAKVSLECLLAPVAVDRVRDWCKCGHGLVHTGVLEELVATVSITLPC
jgi:hypothetical protein